MTLIKKTLKENLSVQYGGYIEEYKKGEKLDIVTESTTHQHYCVAFDIGIFEYVDKSYFED